jgi:hypothetical protein
MGMMMIDSKRDDCTRGSESNCCSARHVKIIGGIRQLASPQQHTHARTHAHNRAGAPYINKHAKGGVLEHLGVVVQRLAVAVLIIFVHLQKGSLQKEKLEE